VPPLSRFNRRPSTRVAAEGAKKMLNALRTSRLPAANEMGRLIHVTRGHIRVTTPDRILAIAIETASSMTDPRIKLGTPQTTKGESLIPESANGKSAHKITVKLTAMRFWIRTFSSGVQESSRDRRKTVTTLVNPASAIAISAIGVRASSGVTKLHRLAASLLGCKPSTEKAAAPAA
jgi:hypothetical protein